MPLFSLLRRWLMALCWLGLAAPAGALVVGPADGLTRPLSFEGETALLRDPSGQLDIGAVSDPAHRSDFHTLPDALEAGYTRDAIWLRIALARSPDAPAQWLLRVVPARLRDVTLYTPDGQGGYHATREGAAVPLAQRNNPDRHIVFPLTLGEAPSELYVRVHNPGSALYTELELWRPLGYEQERNLDTMFTGALLGAVALALCMNLCFAIWLRDRLYAHYALYLVALCAQVLARMGYLEQWLPPARMLSLEQILLTIQCVFYAVFISFMARLFSFDRHSRAASVFFRAVVGCNLAALVPVLMGHTTQVVPWIAAGTLASTLLGALFVSYLIGVKRQFQYLLPAGAFSVSTALGVAMLLRPWLGKFLDLDFDEHLILLGTVTHLILVNVAVANRTRLAERNYRLEKDRVWSVMREAEQALESKVAQRTAELAHTNTALHAEIDKRSQLETSQLRSLEVQRRAIEQQHEFVSMVSHEFRTPLAVIDATAQSLDISSLGTDPIVKSRTVKIRRSVQRLSMLIENILSTDRLQFEQHTLRREPVDLDKLLRALCDGFSLAGTHRLRLEVQTPAPELKADRSLLEIALQNLLHNALKYSPSECEVNVVLAANANEVWVDVVDQGSGIAPDEVPHIFEPYYRSATQAKVPGSGLGLHLAHEIARRHGGEITLRASSTSGSTFRLTLPTSPSSD